MDSKSFAKHIRALEEEGNKLLNQQSNSPYGVASAPAGSLSTLVQKKLREDNISQSRLEESMLHRPHTSIDSYHRSNGSYEPSPPSFLTPPNTALPISSVHQRSYSFNQLPTSSLAAEKAALQTSATIEDLRRQLEQSQKTHEDQRRQFRLTNEEINRRLHDVMVERDKHAAARAEETTNQDLLISKLHNAVSELHQTTATQEESLKKARTQLEFLELVKADHDSMIEMLRTVLVRTERDRGRPYYESEPVLHQSTSMLIHSLERYIEESTEKTSAQQQRIGELDDQVLDLKDTLKDVELTTDRRFEDRHRRMQEDLENKLSIAEERAANSTHQSTGLKQQLELVSEQYRNSESMREEQNRMLEERLQTIKLQMDDERQLANSKLESVSKALDDTQRDLTTALSTKDELERRCAVLEGKVTDYEVTADKLHTELESEKDQARKMWERDNETQNRNVEVETKMALKDAELARLECLLEKTKDECTKKIQQEVALVEKFNEQKLTEEKDILVKQVDVLTERHQRAVNELQATQVDNTKLNNMLSDVNEKMRNFQSENFGYQEEISSLRNQILTKNDELDRVIGERDRYMTMVEERNGQLNDVTRAREHQTIQREEREVEVRQLEEAVRSLESRLLKAQETVDQYDQENLALHTTRAEFEGRIREMEASLDKLAKKMRSKDKKLADGDSERRRLEELLSHKSESINQLEQEVRNAQNEAKECQREVNILTEERNALKSIMKGQEGELQNEIHNLINKLKAMEHDYRLAKKALKSKESADRKAVHLTDKLQAELKEQRRQGESLRGRIRLLEDGLEAATREKRNTEVDLEDTRREVSVKSNSENKLQQKIQAEHSKSSMLTQKVLSLEEGLKQAISRCAALQEAAQRSEQELYKLNIKHQLELRELKRSDNEKSAEHEVMSKYEPIKRQNRDDGVAVELQSVLRDMKDLLHSAQDKKLYESRSPRRRRHSGSSHNSSYGSLDLTTRSLNDDPGPPPRSPGHKRSSTASGPTLPVDQSSTRSTSTSGRSSKHRRDISEPLRSEAQKIAQSLEQKLDNLAKLSSGSKSESKFISRREKPSKLSPEELHKYLREHKYPE